MKKCQRIVSIILVISMMMTSSSFAVLADSVDETITATDDTDRKDLLTKYYDEMKDESDGKSINNYLDESEDSESIAIATESNGDGDIDDDALGFEDVPEELDDEEDKSSDATENINDDDVDTHGGGVEPQEIENSNVEEKENNNDGSKNFTDDVENSTESVITIDDVVDDATESVVDEKENTNPLKDDKVSNASESDVLEKNTNEVEKDAVSTISQLFLLSTASDIEQDIELEPATESIVKPEVYDEGDFSDISTDLEDTEGCGTVVSAELWAKAKSNVNANRPLYVENYIDNDWMSDDNQENQNYYMKRVSIPDKRSTCRWQIGDVKTARHYHSVANYWHIAYIKGFEAHTAIETYHLYDMPNYQDRYVIGKKLSVFYAVLAKGFSKRSKEKAIEAASHAWEYRTSVDTDGDNNEAEGYVYTQNNYSGLNMMKHEHNFDEAGSTHIDGGGWVYVDSISNRGSFNWYRTGATYDNIVNPVGYTYRTGEPEYYIRTALLEFDNKYSRRSSYIELAAGCTFNGMLNNEVHLSEWHFHDANGHNLFANMPNLKKFQCETSVDFSDLTDATGMFENDTKLEEFIVDEGPAFKNLTNTTRMFKNCTSLKNIDLSGVVQLTNVSIAESMFEGCTNLETVDLGDMSIDALVNAKNMFKGCSKLKTIKVNSVLYDAPNITVDDDMFYGCTSIVGAGGTKYDPALIGSEMARNDLGGIHPGYFHYDGVVDVKFDFRKITFPSTAIKRIDEIKNIRFYNTNTPDPYDAGGNTPIYTDDTGRQFYGQISGDTLNIHWAEGNIFLNWYPDFSDGFAGWSSLETIDMTNTNMDASSLTNMARMFKGCSNLKSVTFDDDFGINAINMESMFEGTKLQNYPKNLNTSHATNLRNMFKDCTNIETFDFNFDFSTTSSVDATYMFKDCTNLKTLNVGKDIRKLPDTVTSTSMFEGCTKIIGGGGYKFDSNHIDGEYARVDYGGILPGYFTSTDSTIYNNVNLSIDNTWVDNITKANIKKIKFTKTNLIEDYESEFSLNLTDGAISPKGYLKDGGETLLIHMAPQLKDLNATSDWSEFFANFSNVSDIEGLSYIDTSAVTDASKVFYNCRSLRNLNLDDLSIKNIENLSSAFEGCTNLTGFTGRIATFSSLQNASKAFKGCTGLTVFSFDLCDTPSLNNTEEMFAGCSNLKTIYVNKNFMGIYGISYDNMFDGCVKLVGGQGFGYDASAKDGEFARVDYGGILPGYYTLTDTSIYDSAKFDLPTNWFNSLVKTKADIKKVKFINNAPPAGGGSAVGSFDEMIIINPVTRSRAYIDGDTVKFHYGHSINKLRINGDASGFFKDFTGLTSVEGLEDKVDFTNVTDISELFSGCTSLTTISLNPNTENVTDMERVFYGCDNLKSVTIGSNLKLNKVTNLESAFEGCKNLKNLDIGISSFSNVTNLKNAFKGCELLEVFSFDICDTPTLQTTEGMFSGCKNLKRIYVNDNFQGLQHIQYDNMFDGCVKLMGGEGFTYSATDPKCKSGEFARVDYGGIMPGYYTVTNLDKYKDVVFDLETDWYKSTTLPKNEVLTIKFYNDSPSVGGLGNYDEMFYISEVDKTRAYVETSTKTVKIHYGHDIDTLKFQVNVKGMFADFVNLKEISGLDKLNASKIENMADMFKNCRSIKNITIPNGLINAATFSELFKDCVSLETVKFSSGVAVKNAKTLESMFENCYSLTSVDLGTAFDIDKVESMNGMFRNCNSLTTISFGSNLNTKKVVDTKGMFEGCTSLNALSLEGFNTDTVLDMGSMFKDCDNLATLVVDEGFGTSKVTDLSHLFDGCKKLNKVTLKKSERVFGGGSSENNFMITTKVSEEPKPTKVLIENLFGGLFESKVVDAAPEKIVDLSMLNTQNVTDMSSMFNGCGAITVLDLSGFETDKVTDFSNMFADCTNLQYIYLRDFATNSVINSNDMFKNCSSLVGGKGTEWIKTKVLDKEYAVVDEGEFSSKPGYFTWGDLVLTYDSNGGEGTMPDEVMKRFENHKIAKSEFNKEGHIFAGWTDQYGNWFDAEGVIKNPRKDIDLTAVWQVSSGGSGSTGGTGGAGGGGTGGVGGKLVDRAINFIIPTPIFENEYTWEYDGQGRRVGLILNSESTVAKAMMKSDKTKGAFVLTNQGKGLKLGGGALYKIIYQGTECWFGFDRFNKMMTGFIATSPKSKILEVASELVVGLSTTETLDQEKIFVETAGTVGKFYLQELEGPTRGMLWREPVTVNGIQYVFDLAGRVISSNDIPIDQGIWEYNPVENRWRYLVPDIDGKAVYYKDTSALIYYLGTAYQYIFDKQGNVYTGNFTWRGKNYYALESGTFKGAATEIKK